MATRLIFLAVVCVGSLAFGQDTPAPKTHSPKTTALASWRITVPGTPPVEYDIILPRGTPSNNGRPVLPSIAPGPASNYSSAQVGMPLFLAVPVKPAPKTPASMLSDGDDYLFGGDSIPTPTLQKIEQAFGKEGLNGFAIENGRVKVPHSQRATYLAALADAKALPPTPAPKTTAPRPPAAPYGTTPAPGTPATTNPYTGSGNPYGSTAAPGTPATTNPYAYGTPASGYGTPATTNPYAATGTPAPGTPSTPYLTPVPAAEPIAYGTTPPPGTPVPVPPTPITPPSMLSGLVPGASPMGFTMHFHMGGNFDASFEMNASQGQAKEKASVAKKRKSDAAKKPAPYLQPAPATTMPRPESGNPAPHGAVTY